MSKKYKLVVFATLVIAVCGYASVHFYKISSNSKIENTKLIKNKIKNKIKDYNEYPQKLDFEDEEVEVSYSINEELQKYIEKLLRRYRSDYSSVVVIDNNNGKILANIGWTRQEGRSDSLNFESTHPSASLIKIITSADVLEKNRIDPETTISFRGKGTTLYRYQLKEKIDRWTRYISFEKAFALSNNVVFGKVAIRKSSPTSIFNMANRFGFNKNLMEENLLESSSFKMPANQYSLAEVASGFNKRTLMSPIHAAVLSSVVANNGKVVKPRLILNVKKGDEYIYENNFSETRAISLEANEELKLLMGSVVKRGTARRNFRRIKKSLKNNLEIGGKTGSITGGIPFGKRDWFTMYAYPKYSLGTDKGISIAVMNINVKKWYVKSTYLAKEIMQFYFTQNNQLLAMGKVKK